MNRFSELFEWLGSIPPDFAFLLSLPFLVAAAGLLADRIRSHRSRDSPGESAPGARHGFGAGHRHVRASPLPPPGSS